MLDQDVHPAAQRARRHYAKLGVHRVSVAALHLIEGRDSLLPTPPLIEGDRPEIQRIGHYHTELELRLISVALHDLVEGLAGRPQFPLRHLCASAFEQRPGLSFGQLGLRRLSTVPFHRQIVRNHVIHSRRARKRPIMCSYSRRVAGDTGMPRRSSRKCAHASSSGVVRRSETAPEMTRNCSPPSTSSKVEPLSGPSAPSRRVPQTFPVTALRLPERLV